MTCERWDVVVVPFPFTERAGDTRRPALVVSRKTFNEHGHTVLSMITSAGHSPWPGDTAIERFGDAGLRRPCVIRLKHFTLDNRLILRALGRLAEVDQRTAGEQVRLYLT